MTGTPATGRDLHIDVPLSNVIVGRRPEGFIADQLVPVTPVEKQSDTFYRFRHLEWRAWEKDITHRAPGTKARETGITVTSDTYFVKNYALAAKWPVEDQVNADAVLAWAETNALQLTDKLMTDYEMRIADLAVTTTNVATVTTVASQWSDATNSKPLTDLITFKENFRLLTGQRPNTIIIPEAVMSKLILNDQLRDILYGDRGGLVTAQQIASLIGVDRVLVPYAMVNTATEQATILGSGTIADIWGKNVWMAKVNLMQSRFTDTWINAFRWNSPLLGNQPMAVQRYPFNAEEKTFKIEVGYYQSEKVISSDLAIRVGSVVA
jgi:hypothetical protein